MLVRIELAQPQEFEQHKRFDRRAGRRYPQCRDLRIPLCNDASRGDLHHHHCPGFARHFPGDHGSKSRAGSRWLSCTEYGVKRRDHTENASSPDRDWCHWKASITFRHGATPKVLAQTSSGGPPPESAVIPPLVVYLQFTLNAGASPVREDAAALAWND